MLGIRTSVQDKSSLASNIMSWRLQVLGTKQETTGREDFQSSRLKDTLDRSVKKSLAFVVLQKKETHDWIALPTLDSVEERIL